MTCLNEQDPSSLKSKNPEAPVQQSASLDIFDPVQQAPVQQAPPGYVQTVGGGFEENNT
jgi:hypothetical protein